MAPLSEYATVPMGSTLFETVLALEKAQEEFDHTKYKHRGVLIMTQLWIWRSNNWCRRSSCR